MDSIIVTVFALAILPYLGLPRSVDMPIVIVLVGVLLYTLYSFVKKHNITFEVPLDDPDDFLNEHDVMGGASEQESSSQETKDRLTRTTDHEE